MKTNINFNKNSLVLAAVIAISLIFAYKVFQTQTQKINSLKGIISQEEAKVDVLRGIEVSNSRLGSFSKNLKKEEVDAIVTKINNFASSSSIEIISIQPQKEESREVYSVLPITLNIRGTYHNIGKFISLLEGPGQFFNARNFNLKSGGAGAFGGEFGMERKEIKKEPLDCSLVVESIFIN